jgi:hypothetical protein
MPFWSAFDANPIVSCWDSTHLCSSTGSAGIIRLRLPVPVAREEASIVVVLRAKVMSVADISGVITATGRPGR